LSNSSFAFFLILRFSFVRAVRKTLLVPTNPVRTTAEFLAEFEHQHAFRFDTSQVKGEDGLELAASLVDNIRDLNDCWEDFGASEQLQFARSCVTLIGQLEELGYLCHMGHHKQVLRVKGHTDFAIEVGLICIQEKSEADVTRYAIFELEGEWEKAEEDRMRFAEETNE
jgi:hypothetical protein